MSARDRGLDLTEAFLREFEGLEEEVIRLRGGEALAPAPDPVAQAALAAERDDLGRQLVDAQGRLREGEQRLATATREAGEREAEAGHRHSDESRRAAGRLAALEERLALETARREGAEQRLKDLTGRLAAAQARLDEQRGRPEPPPNDLPGPGVVKLREDLDTAQFELEKAREELRRALQDNNYLRDELRSGGGRAGAPAR